MKVRRKRSEEQLISFRRQRGCRNTPVSPSSQLVRRDSALTSLLRKVCRGPRTSGCVRVESRGRNQRKWGESRERLRKLRGRASVRAREPTLVLCGSKTLPYVIAVSKMGDQASSRATSPELSDHVGLLVAAASASAARGLRALALFFEGLRTMFGTGREERIL